MLGRKTVEAEILKDALEIAQAKSTYRTCPYYHPTIPNTTNSTNTGVSRSNLYCRLKQPNMKSRSRYNKADDHILLPMIRYICDQRP